MNKVLLKGRTTKKPEITYTQDGMCVARFTLAIEDRSFKDKDGKFKVDYITCNAISKLGELIERRVGKGQEILCCGKWRTSFYEKNGKTNYSQVCFVNELYFCGKKQENFSSNENGFMDVLEEELPFK